MEKYYKKIAVALIAMLIVIGASYFATQSSKEYINGNVLRIPYNVTPGQEPITVMPWVMNGLSSVLTYRSLLIPDYTLVDNFKPDLASKIDILEDGYLYKVHFIEGNKWSDGKEITLDDLIYSMETLPSIPRANNLYKSAFAAIESMEIEGNILNIRMKERTTMLIPMLAQLRILPKHRIKDFTVDDFLTSLYWKDPVVSGMYKVGAFYDTHYTLVENENFTGAKKPKIESIEFRFSTSDDEKLDYYFTNNITEMLNFRAMRGYQEFIVDMLFYRYFVFNVEGVDGNVNNAMKDIRVRQAICMAIDREKLLSSVYYNMGNIVDGAGKIGNLGPYNYNPIKAKELLAESGYDLNRTLRIAYYYGDVTSKNFIAELCKQLEAIGFKVEAIQQGGADALYNIRAYDVMLKGFGATQASEWYEEYLSINPLLNKLHGGHGEMDDIINQLVGEPDKTVRDALLQQLATKELEVLYKFPLHTLNQSVYINTDRVKLPNNFKHGNYFYAFDFGFENWEIRKQ